MAGLIAVGLTGAMNSARADELGFRFSIGGHRPLGFLPPLPFGPRFVVGESRYGYRESFSRYPQGGGNYRSGECYPREDFYERQARRHERQHRNLEHDSWHYENDYRGY